MWDVVFDTVRAAIDSVNTGAGKAALAVISAVLALVVFRYARKDRGESREDSFEELRQKVVDAMSKNDASLEGLSVEAEIIDELEDVLLIVPEHANKTSAEQALAAARGFSAGCKENTLAPRHGRTVQDVAALQPSPNSKKLLRHLLMSESITAGYLTQSKYDAVFNPVRKLIERFHDKKGTEVIKGG
jgi:hypothetical protein